MALTLSPPQMQSLIERTDPAILQDRRLLQLFFTHPLPRAPEYLAAILRHLGVHVNFLYYDPLRILLTGIRDVLRQVKRPNSSRCPTKISNELVESTSYLQSLTPRSFEQALLLPTLQEEVVAHWTQEGRALVRPPELSSTGTLREDGLLLSVPELETFLTNSRQFLDVLLEFGLNQEQLHYLQPVEQGEYLAPLLELFQFALTPRIRRFAIDYAFQLVPLGVDLYHDLFFQTLHNLLRIGAVKTLTSTEGYGRNFDQITDLLTFWLRAGFDINYQYAKPLVFAEEYGVPAHESEDEIQLQTVHYAGCSVLALAAIYNRADVFSWLLQFCGPTPVEAEEEETNIFPRTLDVTSMVLEVSDEELEGNSQYLTIPVILRKSEDVPLVQCESNILDEECLSTDWTILQLAHRHGSSDCEELLVDYGQRMHDHKQAFDPLVHDVRQLGYQF
jgi:hypothetical protein